MRTFVLTDFGDVMVNMPDPTGEIQANELLSDGNQVQLRACTEGFTVWLQRNYEPDQPEPDDDFEVGFEPDDPDLEYELQGNYPMALWNELAGDLARAHYALLIEQLGARAGH